MKKITLIEATIDFLASDAAGDSKGTYHPEIVKVHLNNAFNNIIYNTWLNGKQFSDFSQLDAWSKTYVVTVVDQIGAKAHGLLPFAPVQLPNGMGIRQVSDYADADNVLAPIEVTANVVFIELDVNTMDSTPTYRLEQNNLSTGAGEKSHLLRFEKLPLDDPIISVDVMMIVPLEQMDDYDDIAMPQGAEDDLMRQVLELISQKPKSDTANDMVNQNPIQ